MSRWPHLISFSLFQPIFFYRFLSTFHCKSLCITLTWGLCHLCLINTIKIMSRTAHFSKDASCSSSKSGSGCSSSESWFLSAWAAWRDWQFYCFGPSLLRSLSHTSHRRASFHLPAPSPVPRLVLISEPRVCEGVSVRVCARVDERKYKADGKKQCMKTESRREMKRTEGLKEMMKSTAGVRSLQSSLPLWAVFLQRLPSFSSYCLHVAQNKSTDMYAQSSSAFKPDTTAACLWFCVCVCARAQILRLAGGLEHLKLEAPSGPVVAEMQDVIKSHVEKMWLPQFLSTAEFAERQKHQPKVSVHVTRLRHTPD